MLSLLLTTIAFAQTTPLPTASDAAPQRKQYLTPGPGWTTATQPQRYVGPHQDAVVVAHWTRMPNQVLWRTDGQDFRLGVLAYHRSQVEHVRLAVDGGPWVEVDTYSVSRQTGHYDYGVLLASGDFTPGWHEVRAVAVPRTGMLDGGTERVLTWSFYNGNGEVPGVDFGERWVHPVFGSDLNAGTEAAPFATVRAAVDSLALAPLGPDGGVIRLMGTSADRVLIGGTTVAVRNEVPLVIRNAPGHAPVFAPNSTATVDEIAVRRLHLDGLIVDHSFERIFRTGIDAFESELYVTRCTFQGITHPRNLTVNAPGVTGAFFDEQDYGGHRGVYVASSRFRNIDGAPVHGVYWMRDTLVQNVRYAGMPAVRCAIDCTVRDVRRGQGSGGATGWVPFEPLDDTSPIENILVDGCRFLEVHGFAGFLGHADTVGLALVNSVFTGGNGGGSPDFFFLGYLIVSHLHAHTLLLGCTLPRSGFYFDYPHIFGTVTIYPDSLMRGVAARVFFDENLSSQPNWNNLTGPEVSGMRFDPDFTHSHWGMPPTWSTWTQGGAGATYVNGPQGDFRVLGSSGAWGRIPLAESWHRYDIDARIRGRRTAATAVGAVRGVGE